MAAVVRRLNLWNRRYRLCYLKLRNIPKITRLCTGPVERLSKLLGNAVHIRLPGPIVGFPKFTNGNAIDCCCNVACIDTIIPMHAVIMPDQIAVPDEGSMADVALEVLAGRVRPDMNRKLRFTGERHGTTIAVEWFFRNMRPAMGGDVAFNSKRFIADITCVWAFTSVNSLMNVQGGSLRKSLQTCRALKWSFSCV